MLILGAGAVFEAVAKATTVGTWRGSRRRTSKHALSGVDDGSSSTSALSAAVSSAAVLSHFEAPLAEWCQGQVCVRVCALSKYLRLKAVFNTGGIY